MIKIVGRFADAEAHNSKAMVIRKQTSGDGHPDVACSLNSQAGVKSEQERLFEAEEHYNKDLTIRKKALGCGHPDVAQSLSNLG